MQQRREVDRLLLPRCYLSRLERNFHMLRLLKEAGWMVLLARLAKLDPVCLIHHTSSFYTHKKKIMLPSYYKNILNQECWRLSSIKIWPKQRVTIVRNTATGIFHEKFCFMNKVVVVIKKTYPITKTQISFGVSNCCFWIVVDLMTQYLVGPNSWWY